MGDKARTGADSYFKMNVASWLLLILGVITLATPALSSEPRVVCYYTNWSVYRPGTAKFNPQNINPYLCTHLIYAFGGFTKDNTLKPFDKYQDIEKGGYAKFTGLKTYNKNLKTMLAIGGWNEGSSRFSPMVASRERRKEFVKNAIKFLRQNRFDGLDLDWEYPAFRDGGKPKDRENYARLVKELREEFNRESEKTNKPRLLLTMAVPAGIEYIQKGFDVKTLNRYLDWMNLLTYDYHSAFEPAVNHHAPLYPIEEPNEYSVDTELNIDYTIKFYLENGADRDKLVLGIPTYGRSYTLFNADAVDIGSPADGPGDQGDATREKGYLAYYEICESLKPKEKNKKRSIDSNEDSEEYADEEEEEEEGWTIMHPNPDAMGPVAYRGNQWVGYDDVDIVRKKAQYVAENGLGGIMFWSIDNDDFRGNCHSKPYPLIEAAKETYIAKLGSAGTFLSVTEKPRAAGRPNRRRNKPKETPSTAKPSAAKTNKRKSSVSSTTPSWNITPEPPTTPDPGSDFKCTDEGFYPHPRDCKKYFWCLDSGPSNLGIVAHQFTCPSGLFFNKAADSCDFARNVLCKIADVTTKAPATKAARTTTTTPTTVSTTRKPLRLSTKNSVLFRTTSTTEAPEIEEEYVEEDSSNEDAEDPRVIKELIDLIKKVGGVEQLEKQLHRAELSGAEGVLGSSTDGVSGSSTTPSPFNKKLYQKVLERARGTNKYTGNNVSQNSRRGPQNLGLESTAEKERTVAKDRSLSKDRPQYTTINRNRSKSSTTEEPLDSEDSEESERAPLPRARAVESESLTTAKSLQYVNIRRARPTTSTSDSADDTASRNALFERSESSVSVSEQPRREASLNVAIARRENQPEYVTIRRQRPTTEEATTIQYEEADSEVDVRETALEREISSQPQYTNIIRARGTPSSSQEPITEPTKSTTSALEESSPEPTTVLAVQISSLLNSPNSAEEALAPETTAATEAEVVTTTTVAPSSSTRRTIPRRRGSTTTTTTAPTSSTTQTGRRPFLRRTKATAPPDPITTTQEPTTTDDYDYDDDELDEDDLEAEKQDAFNAAKKLKAAEASRKEALATQKEADAFEKEVVASKKEDQASKLEAEAFVREAAERNATGSTSRPNRRGPNRFKSRKQAIALRKVAVASRTDAIAARKEAEAARKEVERNETLTDVDAEVDARIRGRRPSLVAGTSRNERPAAAATQAPTTQASRNFARRRQSGGSGSTTTAAPTSRPATVNRRPFRVASRRRLPTPTSRTTAASINMTSTRTITSRSTTTSRPTTTSPPTTTLMLESEELLQDIGDIDAIEDPTLEPRLEKKGSKVQRRPLVNFKDDQNPSATTEEERRRQSKKYSSTFKQNQLEDILKKTEEVTTEAGTTIDDAETALAIATHQLFTAPLPRTNFGGTRNTEYSTAEYTKTPAYEEYTTVFRTVPTQDFVQTTVGDTYSVYDTPRLTTVDDYTTVGLTAQSRRPVSTTDYEAKTTYDIPKTTSSLRSSDRTDIDTGKFTLETFPTTALREAYTNIPTDFSSQPPTTFEAPKLSTFSRYPTTTAYQPVTNQYVPPTRDYTSIREYTETTDSRSYPTPRTLASRDFSSPNEITPGYTAVQRGGVKFANDRYETTLENTAKYTTTPVGDSRSTRARYNKVSAISGSTVGYTGTSQEPAGFYTREYLLESPITKTYDDEYQYLSPTTPQTSTRKVFRKKIQRRISTTIRPTIATSSSTILTARATPTYVPEVTTPKPTLRPRTTSKKPFEKIAKTEPNRTYKPVINYDYYEDSEEKVALKYAEGTKVILHGKGSIECLDVGNFPHPSSCKKFISCARMEFGSFLGWEYVCPQGLSFDPVGGICNWSAGLGCDEKDA